MGITVDNNLNFEQHISQIVHNANVRAALILRSFASRDPTILVKAFTIYVRPVLEYCTPVWSPHNIGLIKKLESVQKKFTKKLLSFTDTDYLSRLQHLNLEILHVRQLKQDLLWCYNILHGNVSLDYSKFFSLSKCHGTRGHPYKIYKQSCRLNVSLHSFLNRIVDVWNMLPFELVCTPTAVQFKRKLKLIYFNSYILDKY